MNTMEPPFPIPKAPGSLGFFGIRQADLLRDFVKSAKAHIGMARLVYVTPVQGTVPRSGGQGGPCGDPDRRPWF
jgi:hypothetical protein